jgi:hypothetical protein
MKNMKTVIIINLAIIALAIHSCNTNKYHLDYTKYYEKYTFKQLADSLYTDTLHVGLDVDSARTQRQWYTDRINELIKDLQDDWQKPDSLFPMRPFNKIKIAQSPWEWEQTLTNEQANKLLMIITDPTSFDWSETTSDGKFVFEFYDGGTNIMTFTTGSNNSTIETKTDWPQFKKMKFGHLTSSARKEFNQLLKEIDLQD